MFHHATYLSRRDGGVIAGDHEFGFALGHLKHLAVTNQVGDTQLRGACLPRAEELAGTAQLEVEFRDLQHAPDLPEAVSGRDAVGVVLAHWIDAYDELTVEALDFVEVDAWVIADVRWRGRGRGSDVVVDVRQADACRVEDGRNRRVGRRLSGYGIRPQGGGRGGVGGPQAGCARGWTSARGASGGAPRSRRTPSPRDRLGSAAGGDASR